MTTWRARARRRRQHQPASVALVVAVLFIGFGISAAVAALVQHQRRDHLGELMDQRAAAVHDAVTDQVNRYSDTVSDIARAVGAQPRITSTSFATITAGLDRARLPGASGVGLVVPTRTGQVQSLQRQYRTRGDTRLTLSAVTTAREHLFVVLNRSLDGTPNVAGRDLSATPEPTEALRVSRRDHRVAASRTYVLLKDRKQPASRQQLSFILAAPIYADAEAPDAGAFRGWILLGLRGGDFIHQTLDQASQQAVAVTLSDGAGGTTTSTPVAQLGRPSTMSSSSLDRQVTVAVGGRQWSLRIRPADGLSASSGPALTDIAAAAGITFSLLLAALVGSLAFSRARALEKVGIATADLRLDIERREAIEAQLLEHEAELEAFAGVVAHDLKAPLASVLGYAEVLGDDYGDRLDPNGSRCLGKIAGNAQRMQNLIDDLLTYASTRDQMLERAPVDLNLLVDDVLTQRLDGQAEIPQIEVGALPTVPADATLLRQVFDNLIGNALKYVAPGTRAYLSVQAEPCDAGWMIEVVDHGIGIAEKDREAVFDTFRRVTGSESFPGTGLGLAICKRIVERHGGRIGVRSEGDHGSCFWFTLPLVLPAPSVASDDPPAGSSLASNPARVQSRRVTSTATFSELPEPSVKITPLSGGTSV